MILFHFLNNVSWEVQTYTDTKNYQNLPGNLRRSQDTSTKTIILFLQWFFGIVSKFLINQNLFVFVYGTFEKHVKNLSKLRSSNALGPNIDIKKENNNPKISNGPSF